MAWLLLPQHPKRPGLFFCYPKRPHSMANVWWQAAEIPSTQLDQDLQAMGGRYVIVIDVLDHDHERYIHPFNVDLLYIGPLYPCTTSSNGPMLPGLGWLRNSSSSWSRTRNASCWNPQFWLTDVSMMPIDLMGLPYGFTFNLLLRPRRRSKDYMMRFVP